MGEALGVTGGAYFVGRAELLRWINELSGLGYTKIEQCANGVFVCQVFDALFPGKLKLDKVNFVARQEYEFVHNYKVLQACFNRVNVQKQVDVAKLQRGKYQDNLEFIQWVKAYYDQKASEEALNYDGRARREEAIRKARAAAPVRRRAALTPTDAGQRSRANASRATPVARKPSGPGANGTRAHRTGPLAKENRAVPGQPTEPTVKKSKYDELKMQFDALTEKADEFETEREFYFRKLRQVEIIIQDLSANCDGVAVDPLYADAFDAIKDELYATEEDIAAISGSEAQEGELEGEYAEGVDSGVAEGLSAEGYENEPYGEYAEEPHGEYAEESHGEYAEEPLDGHEEQPLGENQELPLDEEVEPPLDEEEELPFEETEQPHDGEVGQPDDGEVEVRNEEELLDRESAES